MWYATLQSAQPSTKQPTTRSGCRDKNCTTSTESPDFQVGMILTLFTPSWSLPCSSHASSDIMCAQSSKRSRRRKPSEAKNIFSLILDQEISSISLSNKLLKATKLWLIEDWFCLSSAKTLGLPPWKLPSDLEAWELSASTWFTLQRLRR